MGEKCLKIQSYFENPGCTVCIIAYRQSWYDTVVFMTSFLLLSTWHNVDLQCSRNFEASRQITPRLSQAECLSSWMMRQYSNRIQMLSIELGVSVEHGPKRSFQQFFSSHWVDLSNREAHKWLAYSLFCRFKEVVTPSVDLSNREAHKWRIVCLYCRFKELVTPIVINWEPATSSPHGTFTWQWLVSWDAKWLVFRLSQFWTDCTAIWDA